MVTSGVSVNLHLGCYFSVRQLGLGERLRSLKLSLKGIREGQRGGRGSGGCCRTLKKKMYIVLWK